MVLIYEIFKSKLQWPSMSSGGPRRYKSIWYLCGSRQAYLPNSRDNITVQTWASLEAEATKNKSCPVAWQEDNGKLPILRNWKLSKQAWAQRTILKACRLPDVSKFSQGDKSLRPRASFMVHLSYNSVFAGCRGSLGMGFPDSLL